MKQAKLNFSSAPRAADNDAGPSRSARKARSPLKQARITSLESPVKAIAVSIHGRRAPRERTSPQNVVTIDDDSDPDDELVASGTVAFGSSDRPIDVDDAPPVASAPSAPSAPPSSKKRKRRSGIQRKLDFGDKTRPYVGVEPNSDSEEEAFHATQLAAAPTPTRAGEGKSLFSESEDDDEGEVAADGVPATASADEEDDSDDSDAIGLPSQRRKRYLKQLDEKQDADAASAEDDEVSDAEELEQPAALPTRKQTFRSNLERLRRRKQGLPTDSEPEDDDHDDDDEDDDDNEHDMNEYGGDDDDDWIVDGDDGDGTSKKSLHELLDEAEGPRAAGRDGKRKSKASGKRRIRSVFADEGENDGLALFRQRRSPQELFKICVQYEVLELVYPQEGVAPESYFRDAIDWLRDRTQGKGEIAKSSVWGQDFTSALSRFPQFEATPGVRGIEIDAPKGDWCDACRRTNRPASWTLKFQGSRYDRLTLEEIDDDTDSEEELAADADTSQSESNEDDDEAAVAEESGRPQSPSGGKRSRKFQKPRRTPRTRAQRLGQGRPFQLGQNCFARAEVVHELIHLRRHLRDAVAARLMEEATFMRRDRNASSVAKQRLANDLTDKLDRTRFTIRLWHRFRAQIERGEELIVGADRATSRRRL